MKPELLAPAGSPASLRAAVESGADAVYMGSIWNARVRARNFSRDELARAISYCHKNNVKAYITLNTLIFETEMPQVSDYIKFVYESGADALIVQDLGVAAMAKEIAPDLPLHASTQLSVHNSKTGRYLRNMGFSRLILAREVSLEQARAIRENSGAEVETFCHGAICYSYSGKCFFSLVQTQRSANRGACSQMCRFPWKLYIDGKFSKSGYLTSTKDMNVINHLPEIEQAGISCIKIEGRLKDAAYIRGVVSAYRKALDRGERPDLSKFTLRGYTEGYLTGEAKKEKLINSGAHSFSGVLLGKVSSTGRDGAQVKLVSPIKVGDAIRASSSGKIIEVFRLYRLGKEVKMSEDICTLQIKTIRAGDTLYKVTRAQIEDEFLGKYGVGSVEKTAKPYKYVSKPFDFAPLPPMSYVGTTAPSNQSGLTVVPFDKFTSDLRPHSSKIVVDTPRVAFDSELPVIEEKMREMKESSPFAFLVSEPSLMSDYPAILSPYANITNTLSVKAWQRFGNVRGVVPSLEIAGAEKLNASLGFATYTGYLQELMISENDLFFELGIQNDGRKYELEDPRGNRFEIVRVGGRTVILKGKEAPKVRVDMMPPKVRTVGAHPKGKQGTQSSHNYPKGTEPRTGWRSMTPHGRQNTKRRRD